MAISAEKTKTMASAACTYCKHAKSSTVSATTQITIKTPNPKCRLYWCLLEFIHIYWRFSQSSWYFKPLLWTSAPLTFSVVHLPTPFPVRSTGLCIYTVCNGGGSDCVESIHRSYTLCIWPDSEPTKLLYHPKQQPRRRQKNTCRQVPLQVDFFKKADI